MASKHDYSTFTAVWCSFHYALVFFLQQAGPKEECTLLPTSHQAESRTIASQRSSAGLGGRQVDMQQNFIFQIPTWFPCIWLKRLIRCTRFLSHTIQVWRGISHSGDMTRHYPDPRSEPRLGVTQKPPEGYIDLPCEAPNSDAIIGQNKLGNTKRD